LVLLSIWLLQEVAEQIDTVVVVVQVDTALEHCLWLQELPIR
jgi:hypothetical protein